MVRQSTEEELAKKIGKAAARKVRAHYSEPVAAGSSLVSPLDTLK